MERMFQSATNFNSDISGWNVSSVTNMKVMFHAVTAFDQDLGSWNVSNVAGFNDFMGTKTPSTFTAANLDAIYNGWDSRPVQTPIVITFGTAKHTSASSTARASLVGKGWTITDGGI
jgi:surface protein